tara:strand:+ start:445 stop:1695 length:1251 start_codon:yes stop_codon:yes gene_type:complete
MITYKNALKILIKNKIQIKSENVLSKVAVGRIASNNIYSKNNYPSANNTAFDGFAINSADTKKLRKNKTKKFKIIKSLAAGDNPEIRRVKKFSTIEVMTGAVICKPFNTVIPIENIKFIPNKIKPKHILIDNKIKKYNHIRFLGSDYKKGEKIVSKGEIIKPSHVLAFKTLGIEKIKVKKIPKIIFYTTGNEISEKIKIPYWKIRNSNSYYLRSYLKNFPMYFKEKLILRDNDEKKFKNEIKKNIKLGTDIVITSGAVSAGKFDFVPKIVSDFKLIKKFKGVSIRPGKPIMFAKFKKNMVFFGLPGNPISSAACFRFFVLPFIFSSLNLKYEKVIFAKLKQKFVKKKLFTRFIKGKLSFSKTGLPTFEILKGQESFRISPFTKTNAWGVLPDSKSIFKKGDLIECYSPSGMNEILI